MNLIINDLLMVKPMSSFTGFLTYMEYALGTEKGGVGGFAGGPEDGFATVTANPFMNGQMTPDRVRYTSEAVVEALTSELAKVTWTPVIEGSAFALDAAGNRLEGEVKVAHDGTIESLPEGAAKIAYRYDNVLIPQEKLPTLVGHMKGIALKARARRIAVFYSQIAAFQAKQDYGMDFESTIAQQAQAELSYQIDSEAVQMIKDAADKENTVVTWVDEELDTIGYSIKAEGFARAIERAKMAIYTKTRKFMPNWMIVSPEVMPILAFVKGFEPAQAGLVNGPYLAGTVSGMKVFVSPALDGKVCYLGVLAADGKSAVGVYAPYLPIIPTQLLGFADGTMSQGFSTMYDMQILNSALLSKIQVLDGNGSARVNCFEGSEVMF